MEQWPFILLLKVGTEIIEILLQKGLDTNSKNNGGETPLYYAMYQQNSPVFRKAVSSYEMAELLIKSGAKIDEATKCNVMQSVKTKRTLLDSWFLMMQTLITY